MITRIIPDPTTITSFAARRLHAGKAVTVDGHIIVRAEGFDDGWQVTTVENVSSMTLYRLETFPGMPPMLTRRLLGTRQVHDLAWKLKGVPETDHTGWVKRVVALAKGKAVLDGTIRAEAA